jgi:DNA polymerase I
VRDWADQVVRQVQRDGYVTTLYGRRRRLPGVWADDPGERDHALRQAVNAVVQGTAADILKLTLVRLHRALGDTGRLLLTVHDSVLVEVPERHAGQVARAVRAALTTPPLRFSVPLAVKVGVGRTWAECEHSKA